MKKTLFLFIIGILSLPLPVLGNEEDGMMRHQTHINVGAGASTYFITGFDDLDDDINGNISNPLVNAKISFDYQGDGIMGVRVPASYGFYNGNSTNAHTYDFGVGWMIHFTKRDKKTDPYAFLGVKFAGARAGDASTLIPIPFANVGLGLRHMVTKRVGFYAEANYSTFFLINQIGGTAGVSIGF